MKKFSKRNLVKIITSAMLVAILALTIFAMPKKAAQVDTSKIIVKDDGSTKIIKNDDISVNQRIVDVNGKDMTFEVDFENYQYQTTQIALVLDNSFSMWSEDKLIKAKSGIINLVNNLYNNIDNVQMSLVTNDGIQVAMGNSREEIISQINNLTRYDGINTKTGLIEAQQVFSNDNINKYIILYTDGQENIQEVLDNIKSSDIKLLTVYFGKGDTITRQYSKVGTLYTITNITESSLASTNTKIESKIKARMIKEIQNVKLENIFSDEIKQNFIFEIVKYPNVGSLTTIENGYQFSIDQLTKNSKVTFQYKLTLKNSFERTIMYRDILTNDSMDISYANSMDEEIIELNIKDSPIIQIADTYTLKIIAINKKYTGLGAEGITFKIEQIDKQGNVIRTEETKTDKDGIILISDITENGEYTFKITQEQTSAAYENLSSEKNIKILSVNKDYISNTITATTSDQDDVFEISTDNNEKIVTATIKMDPREFIIKLRKIDGEYKNELKDVIFSMEEPAGKNIPEDIVVVGKTDERGIAVLTGEVAGEGRFIYKLTEQPTVGYYPIEGAMSLNIEFNEEGAPINITSNSENVIIDETNAIKEDTINIDVTNKMLDYTLKVQAFNEKYKNIKIDNVQVQIIGRDENNNVVYDKTATTDKGIVELPINKYGTIQYTIHQISAPAEYILTEDTTYTITRTFEDNNLVLNSPLDDEDIILDNQEKVLTVNIYLQQKTFNFNITKTDKDFQDIHLDGANLNVIQPEKRATIEGITSGGVVNLVADVVCENANQDGTYTSTYEIKEIQKPYGYQQIKDNIKLNVTFDENGNVIRAESLNTEFLEVKKADGDLELNLKNERQVYSLEVIAKNKNYKEVLIPNVQISVTGTTENGTFLNKTNLVTDENGKTEKIEKLKQDGILKFEIEEFVAPNEYLLNDENAYVQYDFEKEELSKVDGSSENVNVLIDNDKLLITIELYLEPKTFDVEISKESLLLDNILLEGAKFEIEQPNIGSVKRNTVKGETKLNEVLVLQPEVAGTSGTYDYILKEKVAPDGFENLGIEVILHVSFAETGRVTTITSEEVHKPKDVNKIDESNDYITDDSERPSYATVNTNHSIDRDAITVKIKNEAKRPVLQINVYNEQYKEVVVPEAEINIIGEDASGAFYTKTLKTDAQGRINVAGINNIGDFDFKVIATKVPAGYLPQSEETIAYLNRNIETAELVERIEHKNVEVKDNVIIVNLYLEPRTFDIEISKFEYSLGSILIPNVSFTVTQPNITEEIERKNVTGVTVKDEKLILKGEVAGEGTYQYTIKEKVAAGYVDNNIEFTLNIEFAKDGSILNVRMNDDELSTNSTGYVDIGEHQSNKLPISIMNYQKEYSITVQLWNSKYSGEDFGIKIPNAKIRVIGTLPSGEKVYDSQEKYPEGIITNEQGIATFKPLGQRGDVDYTIQILEIPTGYILPESKVIYINKDEITTEITLRQSDENVEIDDSKKDIHVNIFADPQTFEIEISKMDKYENDILIEGATFGLTQPSFGNAQREIVTGRTKRDEKLVILGEVAGEGGPYTYTLQETKVPSGYTVDNDTTTLEITFNKDGSINTANCLNEESQASIQNVSNTKIDMNVINTKKPYEIHVIASKSTNKSVKVEGLKLKIIGRNSANQIVYESEELITDEHGKVEISNLTQLGDVTYEIQQLPDAPAAFILGDSKYAKLNIDRYTNDITLLQEDEDISVNNSSKVVTVKLYLEPKRFAINLSKLDYDDNNKGIRTLLGGARFRLTNPDGLEVSETSEQGNELVIMADVGGKGQYTYELWESVLPKGYQEFHSKIFLDIVFDEHGNIIPETYIEYNEDGELVDEYEPVGMTTEWWTWRRKDGEIIWYEDKGFKKGDFGYEEHTANSVDIFVTNVKKEYTLRIQAIDDKYKNTVDDVYLEVTGINGNGEQIFKQIVKTENGEAVIPEMREVGVVGFKIKEVSVPTCYEDFSDKDVWVEKKFPEKTIIIDEERTSKDIEVTVGYAEPNENGPVNTVAGINVKIPIHRKTFDINLNKVDIDNEKLLLPGAKFQLVQSDEKHTQTEVTDEEGYLKLSADIEGISDDDIENEKEYLYVLRETQSPKGYNEVTTDINLYVTLNKNDEITNVRITNGSSIVFEQSENRTDKSIDLLVKNSKGGNLYNLQLTKKYDNKPIKDDTYKIKIECQSGENLTVKDITDSKGQIYVSKIPGNDKIVITMKEIKAPEGYYLDQTEKIVTLQRDALTGKIEIIEEDTSDDVTATYDDETKTVYVEINSPAPKKRSNIVRILSVDNNDITKMVAYSRVKVILPNEMGEIEKTTDKNGCINLDDVGKLPEGTYKYIFRVLSTPTGYFDFQGGDILVDITYDEYGSICSSNLAQPHEYAEAEYVTDEDEDNLYDIANVIEKNIPKEILSVHMIKKGEQDSTLKDVEFDITSLAVIAGNEVLTTTSKKTDKDGIMDFEVVSGDRVELTLVETKTSPEYKLDSTPIKINFEKDSLGNLNIIENESSNNIEKELVDNNLNLVVSNKFKQTNVIMQLINEDKDGNAIKLAGIEIKVAELSSGNEYMLKTDKAGEINFNDLPVHEEGIYQFVISSMTGMRGYKLSDVTEENPIKINVEYIRTENDNIEVKNISYESQNHLIEGISSNTYTAPDEYRLFLRVVLSDEIMNDAPKYDVNVYKIDKTLKEEGILKYLSNANFDLSVDYLDESGLSVNGNTDTEGKFSFTVPYIDGLMKIQLQELKAPEGYNIDDADLREIVLNKDANGNVSIDSNNLGDNMIAIPNDSNLNIYVMNTNNPENPGEPEKEYDYNIEIDKINKNNLQVMRGVQFTVNLIDAITGEIKGEPYVANTNSNGQIILNIDGARANTEYAYLIKETTPMGYKDIEDIKVKIVINENGEVENITEIIENTAIKELKVEDGIAKVVVQNEEKTYEYDLEINKIDKETLEIMQGVQFTISPIDEITGDVNGEPYTAQTDENGKLILRVENAIANREYSYLIQEQTPNGYKDIKDIKVKVSLNANGEVIDITELADDIKQEEEVIEETEFEQDNEEAQAITNPAIKELKVEDGIAKVVVQNEKEEQEPGPGPDQEYEYEIEIDKIDKETLEVMAGVEFTIVAINEETGEEISSPYTAQTDEEGKIIVKANKVKANTECTYLIKEKTPNGYKDIEDIKVKVSVNENGEVQSIVQLEENDAVKEVKVEDGIVKIIVQNEKEEQEPGPGPDQEYEYDIEIDKIDKNTLEIMPGVEFTITEIDNETGEEKGEPYIAQTDKDGKLTIHVTGAKANTEYSYLIKETTPDGYKDIEDIKVKVSVNANGEVESIVQLEENDAVKEVKVEDGMVKIIVQNEKEEQEPGPGPNPDQEYEYEIEIDKIDKETLEVMAGVEFTIVAINEETGEEISSPYTAQTDEEGKIIVKANKVKANTECTYLIKEKTPNGYKDIEDIKVKVSVNENGEVQSIMQLEENDAVKEVKVEDGIVKIIVQNEKEEQEPGPGPDQEYEYEIEIDKIDKDTLEIMPGVEFTITEIDNETGEEKGEPYIAQTDEEGKIIVKANKVKANTEYSYLIKEKTPNGYKDIEDIKVKVSVDENGEVQSIVQLEENDAVKEVKVEDGRVKIVVQNEKEEQEPGPGPDQEYEYEIEIDKIDKETLEVMAGVEFTIVAINEETGEEISSPYTAQTDEEGKIIVKANKVKANTECTYLIKEKKPNGYKDIEDIKVKVSVNENGEVQNIVQLEENGAVKEVKVKDGMVKIIVQNEKEEQEPGPGPDQEYEYDIEIDKIDKNTLEIMPGVEFTIVAINEETGEEISSPYTAQTDEEGKIIVKANKVKANTECTYLIKEKTPNGYKDIEDIKVKVSVNENGEVQSIVQLEENNAVKEVKVEDGIVKIIVQNEKEEQNPGPGPDQEYEYDIEIDKIDKDTLEIIPGVRFTITEIDNETGEEKGEPYTAQTDKDGKLTLHVTGAKANTEYSYLIKETTPNGYKNIEDIRVKVSVNENGEVQNIVQLEENVAVKEVKVEDGMVKIIVQNEKEEQEPGPGPSPDQEYEYEIEIDKIDKETVEVMAGVEFTIVAINEETGEEISNPYTAQTDKNGKLSVKIRRAKANTEYSYLIKEKTPNGYKNIEDIKIKIKLDENGQIESIIKLEDNMAIKELKIENGIAKLLVQNEREKGGTVEPDNPENPDNPDNPGNTDKPENPDRPDEPDKPNNSEKPNKPNNPDKPNGDTIDNIKDIIDRFPYAGAKSILPMLSISVIIAIINYFRYRKHKI